MKHYKGQIFEVGDMGIIKDGYPDCLFDAYGVIVGLKHWHAQKNDAGTYEDCLAIRDDECGQALVLFWHQGSLPYLVDAQLWGLKEYFTFLTHVKLAEGEALAILKDYGPAHRWHLT